MPATMCAECGEEGLFTDLAESNIKAISSCEFERILTTDPHSFQHAQERVPEPSGARGTSSTTRQLLLELFEAGALAPSRQLDTRVTYHDPCTLGRYNGVYDEPRRLIAAIGCELVEMQRTRDNSFCCGAGGGRIWMSELKQGDAPRPSESRIHEATALERVSTFVVCCPKDVTMYEDAVKTSGHEGDIEVRELTELVLDSLELGAVGVVAAKPGADAA